MCRYREICKEMMEYHHKGIFFAFSNEQFKEGLEELGLKETDDLKGVLFKGPYGEFGTKEGYVARAKYFAEMEEKIKKECTPEEVFEYEFANHECGYTMDWTIAEKITREHFPQWTPPKELINKLMEASLE